MHENFDNERQLDEITLRKIEIIRDTLEKIAADIGQPIDPKVIALLEMASDMLHEQVHMDKVYEYPECPHCTSVQEEKPNYKMAFFTDDNSPSAKELEDMFNIGWTENDPQGDTGP